MKKYISTTLRRALSLLLCLAMVLPMLPAPQFAKAAGESSTSEAINQLTQAQIDAIVARYPGDGTKSKTLTYDCGNYLTAGREKSYMTMVTGTSAAAFNTFKANLVDAGYKKTSERSNAAKNSSGNTSSTGNLFANFVAPDGSYRVYTYYLDAYKETRIIVDTQSDTVQGFQYTPQVDLNDSTKTVAPKLVMWGLPMSDVGYDITEQMAPNQIKQRNCGAMMVMLMPDNSLFINDGGDVQQWDDAACDSFLEFCRKLTGTTGSNTKMVINTWFISHAHGDHFKGFYRFLNKYYEQFEIKNVVYNIDREREDVLYNLTGVMSLIAEKNPDVRYYKPHTGEVLNIAGVEFEVLYTHEDRFLPDINGNLAIDDDNLENGTYREEAYTTVDSETPGNKTAIDFNDTSTVMRVTFPNNKTALLYGDLTRAGRILTKVYPDSMLTADIVQVPHHGFNVYKPLMTAAKNGGTNGGTKVFMYFQRKTAVTGPDLDVNTVDMYGTYHIKQRDFYMSMFDKDGTDYQVLWAGNNTVTIDINDLTYKGVSTPEVNYTGWLVTDVYSDPNSKNDMLLSATDGSKEATVAILSSDGKKGTYDFSFELVDAGTIRAFYFYALMHKETGNVMAYSPVVLDSGRANHATSLKKVEGTDLSNAGCDVYYENGKRIYFDHSNLDRVVWVTRQSGIKKPDTSTGKVSAWKSSLAFTDTIDDVTTTKIFGTKAYRQTYLAKPKSGDDNVDKYFSDDYDTFYGYKGLGKTVEFWYSSTAAGADGKTQYRYLNPQKVDAGWVSGSSVTSDQHIIEYLGQETVNGNKAGRYLIYYIVGDGSYNFLTCDKYGNWGIKNYTKAQATANLENLVLYFYHFKGVENKDEAPQNTKIKASVTQQVFNVEQGTSMEQIISYIQTAGNLKVTNPYRNNLEVACSGTEQKVGHYFIQFNDGGTSADGTYSTLNVAVRYHSEEGGHNETLLTVTVNVWKRDLKFSGTTDYVVAKGTSETQIRQQINAAINVKQNFSNTTGNLYTSGDQTVSYSETPTAGSYWLELVPSTDGNLAYYVNVNYRRTDGSDDLVKVLSVVNQAPTSVIAPQVMEGLALVNAGLGAKVLDAEGEPVTITVNGETVDVTVGMLSQNGMPVSTAAEVFYDKLTLTYGGKEVCTDFKLTVTKRAAALDNPAKGEPGHVETNKQGTTSLVDFSNSGVANIQLSATGTPLNKGVDLIVVMDLSGSMLNNLKANGSGAYEDTRIYALENSLKDMVKALQQGGGDVRIAMTDFGNLDHYKFDGAVVDTSIIEKPVLDADLNNGKYPNMAEFNNHLNYIFSKADTQLDADNRRHYPYGIHYHQFDKAEPKYTGEVIPYIYTGSGKVGTDAFVDVNTLYDGHKFTANMGNIIRALDVNVQKSQGTNYDVGLQYAYHLGYAIQQANIAEGKDRDQICVFMSDGAPMQFNYFSGTNKSDAWVKWTEGELDSINYKSLTESSVTGLAELKDDLLQMLKQGTLVRPEYQREFSNGWIYKTPDGAINATKADRTVWSANVTKYFLYRDRYAVPEEENFYNYMDKQQYDLDWDYLCRIAYANGIEDFDFNYYQNDTKLTELMDKLLDKGDAIGYERIKVTAADGKVSYVAKAVYQTKLIDPGLAESEKMCYMEYTGSETDFFAAMKAIGVDCSWDLFVKIAYKNRDRLKTLASKYKKGTLAYDLLISDPVKNREKIEDDLAIGKAALEAMLDNVRSTSSTWNTLSPYSYFYNSEGKNWWAEAIKGDTDKVYPVINLYAKTDSISERPFAYNGEVANQYDDKSKAAWCGQQYMSGFRGLGMDMYTILFVTTDSALQTQEVTTGILQRISSNAGSTGNFAFTANSEEELTSAMKSITAGMSKGATQAFYTDTMGEAYDLYYGQYVKDKAGEATIKVMEYNLDAAGNRVGEPNIREIITIESDGVAYSNLVLAGSDTTGGSNSGGAGDNDETDEGATGDQDGNEESDGSGNRKVDIWQDGLIKGKYVYYNTKKTGTIGLDLRGDDGVADYQLQPETFFWIVGNIGTTELVLEYQVYLTGSFDSATRGDGLYDTNSAEKLTYINYLGNTCTLDPISPAYPWGEGRVGTALYLVNSKGQPIVDLIKGTTGTFDNAVKLTDVNYTGVKHNEPVTVTAPAVPVGYKLYETSPSCTVSITSGNSNNNSWEIAGGNTTYVVNNGVSSNNNWSGTGNCDPVVWFAVCVDGSMTTPDSVVVDYGLPVEIPVLDNDANLQKLNASVGAVGKIESMPQGNGDYVFNRDLVNGFTNSCNGTFGSASVKGNTIRYEMSEMGMNTTEKFAYAAKVEGSVANGYYYETVTVIPATTIYYEDNFITYTSYEYSGQGATTDRKNWKEITDSNAACYWKPDGTATNGVQSADRPGSVNIYGNDAAYNNCAQFSMGSARKVTVGKNGNSGRETTAEADFTFWGTGFDVISMTSSNTGTIVVQVFDENGNQVTSRVVDTYYGYEYEDEKWVVTNSSDALYQVPVIKVEGLSYAQYSVKISVVYNSYFDHKDGSTYDFYLDAIRIYDPAGSTPTDEEILGAYEQDGETPVQYQELRNLLLKADSLGEWSEDGSTKYGALFIDGLDSVETAGITDYANYGPNNETYLAAGQGVAFTIGEMTGLYIAMKKTGINETGVVKVKVYAVDDNSIETKIMDINTATDQYYDFSAYKGKTIAIVNESDAGDILSITNLKMIGATATNAQKNISMTAYSFERFKNALVMDKAENSFILAGANTVLGGVLDMNFFINPADLNGTDYYAEITLYAEDGVVTTTVPYADWEVRTDYLVVTQKGLAARQMADKIEVVIYNGDGTAASEVWTDSIRDYVVRILEKQNDETKTMLVDMLNYGAAAQAYFNYNTNDLANSVLTDAQKAYASDSVVCTDQRVKGEGYYGSSLTLKDRITLTMYFNNITPDMYAVVSFTDHKGEAHETRVEGSAFAKYNDGIYGVDVDELVVADGNQLVTVTVYDADGNVVATAIDSVNSYAARQAGSNELFEMVAKFTTSAYAHFH